MMLNDPRSKARSFLESTPIVSQIEEALNGLIYEKPEDLHGYLVKIKRFIFILIQFNQIFIICFRGQLFS